MSDDTNKRAPRSLARTNRVHAHAVSTSPPLNTGVCVSVFLREIALAECFEKNKSKKDPLREKEFREISVEKRPFSVEICPILPMDQIRLVEKISDFHPYEARCDSTWPTFGLYSRTLMSDPLLLDISCAFAARCQLNLKAHPATHPPARMHQTVPADGSSSSGQCGPRRFPVALSM